MHRQRDARGRGIPRQFRRPTRARGRQGRQGRQGRDKNLISTHIALAWCLYEGYDKRDFTPRFNKGGPCDHSLQVLLTRERRAERRTTNLVCVADYMYWSLLILHPSLAQSASFLASSARRAKEGREHKTRIRQQAIVRGCDRFGDVQASGARSSGAYTYISMLRTWLVGKETVNCAASLPGNRWSTVGDWGMDA